MSTEWDGKCVLGHCGSPSGCERDGYCRADSPPSADMVTVPKELVREARDNCLASIAEDGISSLRKEYRCDLYRRLSAALNKGA